MTRLSRYFLPTRGKRPPTPRRSRTSCGPRRACRQVGAGLWTCLPAGWRVHQKVEQIIREEMDAIGAQEMLMPVLQPAELWKQTGRYEIDELFKLKDRRGAEMVLAMTHEEVITTHVAAEVRSYRDLPKLLYHFQTKERDEPRPRAGRAAHARVHHEGRLHLRPRPRGPRRAPTSSYVEAYDRIFDRAGLEWYRVESDVGMMGGVGAHEYMAPCAAGENDVALAPGYAANVEIASADAAAGASCRRRSTRPRRCRRPALTTVDAVAERARACRPARC